jgi:hypothetical protein
VAAGSLPESIKMDIVIKPLIGFDGVLFGMSRSDVRSIIGDPQSSGRRFVDSLSNDFYANDGLFCYYDDDDRLTAFEIGASLGSAVMFGEQMFLMNYD